MKARWPAVLVFDAYGTLFDLTPVTAALETAFPTQGKSLGQSWRDIQLRYTWLYSLTGRWVDFEQVTADAWVAACQNAGRDPTDSVAQGWPDFYRRLPPFPDAAPVLQSLRDAGWCLVLLSNGTTAQLNALIEAAGWQSLLRVLSADAVRAYKPDPRVYRLVPQQLGVAVEDVVFISSNAWDVVGALAFGFRCAWLNRSGAPFEVMGLQPDWVLHSLSDLADRLTQR